MEFEEVLNEFLRLAFNAVLGFIFLLLQVYVAIKVLKYVEVL
jgi:hypothetical protein